MARSKIYTRYDLATGAIYTDDNYIDTFSTPQYLVSKNKYILCITLLDNGVSTDYSYIVDWNIYFGNLSVTGDGELITITDSDINDTDDWSDADPSIGLISCKLDLNDAVATSVGTNSYRTHYLQITGSDGVHEITIALIPFRTKPIVHDPYETLAYSSSSSSSSSSEG